MFSMLLYTLTFHVSCFFSSHSKIFIREVNVIVGNVTVNKISTLSKFAKLLLPIVFLFIASVLA